MCSDIFENPNFGQDYGHFFNSDLLNVSTYRIEPTVYNLGISSTLCARNHGLHKQRYRTTNFIKLLWLCPNNLPVNIFCKIKARA